jgi:2,3-bisphosphoglycerate-dependent phosphoglycerate mutase
VLPAWPDEAASLDQLSIRATAALTALAASALDGVVVVGSHGTFIARALLGLGIAGIDWPFCAAMPMPAVYRLWMDGDRVSVDGPGLAPRADDAPG